MVQQLDSSAKEPADATTTTDIYSSVDYPKHADNKDSDSSSPSRDEESAVDDLPNGRQLGLVSSVFLMFNRIVGTGVFSTTSTILAQSGSPGMSLIYWVIGSVIAFAGFYVYAEYASSMTRNGGELNYLSKVYGKPRYLVASMYAAQAFLLGQAAGNAYAAGQYFIRAGGHQDTSLWAARGIGVAVLVSCFIMHTCFMTWGLRFQNAIGIFKVVILLLIALAGFGALAGHIKVPNPHNFENAFAGSRNDVYSISSCIYNAIWSYVGYSNLFYAVGEVKNPYRTIRIAGPLAILVITIVYVLVQIAYFAAVPKDEILASKQIIAALFFKNMFGESSARALSVFVALSAVANVYTVVFAQGRLVQALGRDGLIPFPKFFASSRPFKAPMAGIGWHVLMTLILLLAPPAGDAYNFVLNLSQYPLNVVNTLVGFGLVAAYVPDRYKPQWAIDWSPPIRASLPVALFFGLVSAFLVVAPWIPPKLASDAVYETIWYGMAPAVSFGVFALGAFYWLMRLHVAPALRRSRQK